jgi:hypothetical protein
MISKISQSFIKDYRDFLAEKECGNIIREKYINDQLFDDEEDPGAKHLGAWFEYKLSGAVPKNGKIPEPLFKPNTLIMLPAYQKAADNARLIRDYVQAAGLKIVKVSVQMDKGMFTGVIDLIVEVSRETKFANGIIWRVGQRFVIDLKYSGLVGKDSDRSNKHGWSWSNVQKEYHGTQAKQYHLISGMPFYFLVTQSNQKEGELPTCRLFYVPIDDYMIAEHIDEGKALFDQFQVRAKLNDFKPYPSLKKCGKCPIRDLCDDKHTYPHPEIVDLTIE